MSAQPAPQLHVVVCEACERKDRMIDAMQVDLQNLEVDLKVKRRQLTAAKHDAAVKRRADLMYPAAEQIFEFWKTKCSPKSRVFGEDREKAVLARLNDVIAATDEKAYPPRFICEAILGAAAAPYVDPKGKKHNDLELICRSPKKLEDFHDRWERWKEREV